MKIICSKSDLSKGIQVVQNIISTKTTLPILSHILLETKGEQLRLASTDLDMGIECLIPARVLEEGGITVPARRIGGIVRELPETDINITMKDEIMTIDCGKGVFKIAGLGRDDFPKLPQSEEKEGVILKQDILKEMLKKTSFAVSDDETRRALNGIFFVVKENKIKLVATDGRRLAYIERRVDISTDMENEVIIPIKASNEISRIIDEGGGEVKIIIAENLITFCLDNIKLTSRLIKGNFPAYQKVIPEKFKERVVLARESFLSVLKRVSVFTSEKSNSIRLDITKDRILFAATALEIGEAREELNLDYKGGDISMALNPVYMLDFLKNEKKDNVCLELTDSLNPCLMKPVISNKEHSLKEKYLYVIMPIKL